MISTISVLKQPILSGSEQATATTEDYRLPQSLYFKQQQQQLVLKASNLSFLNTCIAN